MNAKKNTAKIAGSIYLIVIVTGMFSLAYVTQELVGRNNSKVTFNNTTTSPSFISSTNNNIVCCVANIPCQLLWATVIA